MEGPDGSGGCGEEGEEETGAEPVDDAGFCGEEFGCCIGDGGKGEPLRLGGQSLTILAFYSGNASAYIPAHNDI